MKKKKKRKAKKEDRRGGGRVLGFEECTMDLCLVKSVYRPSKTLLIGQLIFWCIPKKGRG